MKLYFLLVLLLLPAVAASPFYTTTSNTIHLKESATIAIVPDSPAYVLEDVTADLYFFPKITSMQQRLDLDTSPTAQLTSSVISFKWKDVTQSELSYEVTSDIKVSTNFPKVNRRVAFPIASAPQEYRQYLLSSEKIDILHPTIVAQAKELAQGENDLFKVATKMAVWVKSNIEYDLSTLTAEVSQTASWVLENKQGVCDELTVLLIAMLRSQGVPARFVSGVAYTESELFPDRWGAHGWAEVYFPGYGWVPYDVTYGEYGWADTTHVVFQHTVGPSQPSTQFSWRGRNVNLQAAPLDIDASFIESGIQTSAPVSMKINLLKSKVGFDSANLVEVILQNKKDYYIALNLVMARVQEVLVREGYEKVVTLAPGEKKTVFWTIELKPGLDEKFVYTFPISIYTRNANITTTFKASTRDEDYTHDEITELREKLEIVVPTDTIDLSCSPEQATIYAYQDNKVVCVLSGNFTGDLCLGDVCKKAVTDEEITFPLTNLQPGIETLLVQAKDTEVRAIAQVQIDVLAPPAIQIADITVPQQVTYDEPFTFSFLTTPMTSTAHNLDITVTFSKRKIIWSLDQFESPQRFAVELTGKDLRPGLNTMIITIEFEDAEGRSYTASESTTVQLVDVTFVQRIILFFSHLF